MTDSRTLLAEYVQAASEAAFRELVNRYLGLVYSTALRLVGGDTHLAQDVAQTVFVHLARKAPGLSPEVMLGGWLHRDACNVAAKVVRGERRRQARERQAMEIQAQEDHTQANLARVAPVLDEVINQLGDEDRRAILLRFFEQRDLCSVGAALSTSEDAARMRVNRALDKLHLLLKKRGVVFSTTALATALAAEAVTAVPVGLAANVTGTALASVTAGSAVTATVLKLMTLTKLKLGIISGLAIAGIAAPLVVQHQSQVRLREENQSLRQQLEQLAQLSAENEQLSNLLAQANGAQASSKDQLSELLRLRGEVGRQRGQTSQLEKLREENRRLLAERAATQAQAATPNPASQLAVPGVAPSPLGTMGVLQLGMTKDEALARLAKLNTKILTNTTDLIVAEFPLGGYEEMNDPITGGKSSKPLTSGFLLEFPFRDGKYDDTDSSAGDGVVRRVLPTPHFLTPNP